MNPGAEKLYATLFEIWVKDKKPLFYPIVYGINIIMILVLVFAIASMWWWNQWWMLLISDVGAFLLFKYVIVKIIVIKYLNEFSKS